ncbi:NmrA-like family protein [Lentinula aff. detonsa]|uniref:NmrA-like family protein n=1 Tax=Lentinula aff. detonsa TaxID=2804958 RepID=A0AA38NHW6_9AGAR|nr:NmrA-like family protein [Lentinula aff. detonsa]KAJ3799499.1 NmrA-like family protein [Lentinula aff. detonsa]
MDNKKVAIFPASGKLGGSLTRHTLKLLPAHDVVLISRYPSKIPDDYRNSGATIRAADYDSPKTLEDVFSQVNVLFLISYPTFQHEHRTKAHKYAIDSAHKNGVKHIFYSSLAFAGLGDQSVAHVMQAHLDTERYLAQLASKDPSFSYTSVREGLYSESFPMYTAFFNLKNPTNEILLPHNGHAPGLAWVKIDELGEASALLLAKFYAAPDRFADKNRVLLLSGPREWSLNETVQALSRVVGREVLIRQVSVDEYAAQKHVGSGLTINGNNLAKEWATVYDAIRSGETSIVTPLLKDLLGREPEDFEATIRGMT